MMFTFRSLAWFVGLTIAAGLWLGPERAGAAESAAEREGKLIEILQSGAPPQEKALTCKKLAVYGGKEAVAALAPLLADKELASWARIALEAIPDPAADAALREALGRVQGRLLVGVINSIGVRRDARAVDGLTGKLKDADPEVVSAAAVALGCVGTEAAASALEPLLASVPAGIRGEVAEGGVRCAEHLLADGKKAAAAALYDAVRKSNAPKPKLLQATRGAILARGAGGLPLLVEQLRSADKGFFSIGLRVARELPGAEVTRAVAAELEKADPSRQAPLVMVLADRSDPTVLPTILKAAQGGPKQVRLGAVSALERMAAVEAVPVLLEVAGDEDRELAQAAKAALVRLPGKDVNGALLIRLPAADGKQRRLLLELASQRRIAEALPAALQSAADADQGVRTAALAAVGVLGEEKQAGDLAALLGKTQSRRDREEIEKALLGISGRRGKGCLPFLLPLARNEDPDVRIIGLHSLGGVGGSDALAAVRAAVQDKSEAVQDEAVRTLSTWPDNWPDEAGVAEPLLALAKSGGKPSHQVLGLRGYLQFIQGSKKLGEGQKVAMVREILPLATRAEEKRLAISALGSAPSPDALEEISRFTSDRAVAEEACLALYTMAARDDLKGLSKELRQKALQTALEKTKVERTRRKAGEALKRIK